MHVLSGRVSFQMYDKVHCALPKAKLRSHYQPTLPRVIAQGKLSRDIDHTSSAKLQLDVIKMPLHVTHYWLILS